MRARPRLTPPPYQVMHAHPPKASPCANSDSHVTATPRVGGIDAWLNKWWLGLQKPMMFRLSQGLAVMLAWGIIVIIFVAGWVGWVMGSRWGMAQARNDGAGLVTPRPTGINSPAPTVHPNGNAGTDAAIGQSIGNKIAGEPRQRGLHYVVLVSTSRISAINLMRFLIQRGVDVFAIKRHNTGLYQVLAPRGLYPEERSSLATERYKDELRRLGREFDRHYPGQGNLADLYVDPRPYLGEIPDEIITKENIP